MTFDCKDLERALAVPELLPDAREHAKTCEACRRELWLWGEISNVAPGLREQWDTPDLWPRIRQALTAEQKAAQKPKFDWRVIGGIAALLILSIAGCLVYLRTRPQATARQDGDFLTEQTLAEVEKAEASYRTSIDKLSQLAKPKLQADSSQAISNREKLLVLDSEISEVRTAAARNRFNAQLQTELASLYREKQDTLKEILQSGQIN